MVQRPFIVVGLALVCVLSVDGLAVGALRARTPISPAGFARAAHVLPALRTAPSRLQAAALPEDSGGGQHREDRSSPRWHSYFVK